MNRWGISAKNGNYKRRPNKNCKTDNEINEKSELDGLNTRLEIRECGRNAKEQGKTKEKIQLPKMYCLNHKI